MRYQIERRLGAGGMAEVYEATAHGDNGFRRKVAIKRLASGRVDDAALRRAMVQEARVAATLHHPGIVAVLDVGEIDGSPMQVLEWVDGLDAGALLARGQAAGQPLPLAAALAIVVAVAEALDHAHHAVDERGSALGLVHRDVKPANVLVSWDGHVRLADFGIAFVRGRDERTATGVAKGTLGYMAPEQLAGAPVDARTDVYALGALLHALCTGRSPVDPDAAPIDVLAGLGVRLDTTLPPVLYEIVEQALAREPSGRYPNALAVARAVEGAARELDASDGSRVLRAWLTALRAGATRPALLDDLYRLDLEIVAVDGGAGPVPQFTMRRIAPAPPQPRPRRTRWLAGLGALVLLLGTVAIWRLVTGAPTAPTTRPAPPAPQPVFVAIAPPDASPPPPPPPLPDAGVAVDARPHAPDAAGRATGSGGRPTPRPDAAPAVATTAELGYLRVPGDPVAKIRVFVDDTFRDYAPARIAVAIGGHRVRFEVDGIMQPGSREVTVGAQHTKSRPLLVAP